MKRILYVSPMILCILYAFFPFCRAIGAVCGYDFVLCNYPISIITLAVISILITSLLFFLKISLSKVQAVFAAILPLLSAINGLFFVLDNNWEATFFFVLICYGCSIAILIKFARYFALKIVSAALSVLLVLFLLFSAFINSIFGDLGIKTVVKSAVSPQNTYLAEIIDSNQGALGGDTLVKVRNKRKTIDLLFCRISKTPLCVYTGDWGEFENMLMSWKDEHTLIINSKEYSINN